MAVNTCRGCTKTWTGLVLCHCPRCHESFSCESHYLAHFKRYRSDKPSECIPPELILNKAGVRVLKLDDKGVKWIGFVSNPLYSRASPEEGDE